MTRLPIFIPCDDEATMRARKYNSKIQFVAVAVSRAVGIHIAKG